MDDWERIRALTTEQGDIQLGMALDITSTQSGLVAVNKDLVRFPGKAFDLNAWRVYLSPWGLKPSMPAAEDAPASPYAIPFPWAGDAPNTSPQKFDNFDGLLYARVLFGSGMVQHEAWIDWPVRGKVIQVSCSYLQLNAYARFQGLDASDISDSLPRIKASIGPEPGGGDSARPATYTYPKQQGGPIEGEASLTGRRWVFQVPPFARSFTPLLDIAGLFGDGDFSGLRIAVQPNAQAIIGGVNVSSWYYTTVDVGDLQGIDWALSPFPIAGQTIDLNPAPATQQGGAVVTIEIDDTRAFPPDDTSAWLKLGCMFELDL